MRHRIIPARSRLIFKVASSALISSTAIALSAAQPSAQNRPATSPAGAAQSTTETCATRFYNVRSLLEPLPDYTLDAVENPAKLQQQQPGQNFFAQSEVRNHEEKAWNALAGYLKKAVAPDSWSDSEQDDKPGHLLLFDKTMVVTQTLANQEAIEPLLNEIRRQSNSLALIQMDADWLMLTPGQLQAWRDAQDVHSIQSPAAVLAQIFKDPEAVCCRCTTVGFDGHFMGIIGKYIASQSGDTSLDSSPSAAGIWMQFRPQLMPSPAALEGFKSTSAAAANPFLVTRVYCHIKSPSGIAAQDVNSIVHLDVGKPALIAASPVKNAGAGDRQLCLFVTARVLPSDLCPGNAREAAADPTTAAPHSKLQTSPSDDQAQPVLRTYDVHQLATWQDWYDDQLSDGGAESVKTPEGCLQDISNIVRNGVDRSSWEDKGGVGTITVYNGTLIIKQTPANHHLIQAILDQFRERFFPRAAIRVDANWLLLTPDQKAAWEKATDANAPQQLTQLLKQWISDPQTSYCKAQAATFDAQSVRVKASHDEEISAKSSGLPIPSQLCMEVRPVLIPSIATQANANACPQQMLLDVRCNLCEQAPSMSQHAATMPSTTPSATQNDLPPSASAYDTIQQLFFSATRLTADVPKLIGGVSIEPGKIGGRELCLVVTAHLTDSAKKPSATQPVR